MDIRSQTYMSAIAEYGSMMKAAKSLGISQPALSSWLNSLEAELDTQLLLRSRSGITFTPAGSIYLEGCRKMIEEHDRFYRAAREVLASPGEILRIGGTSRGGARAFAGMYRHFKSVMPSVTLQFQECYNRDMLNRIRKNQIDFGIGSITDLAVEDIEYLKGTGEELILLIPEGFNGYYDPSGIRKDAELPSVQFEIIENAPFIMPTEQVSFHSAISELFAQADFHPNIIFETSNTGSIYQMIKAGNGVGVISRRNFSPLDHVAPYSFAPKLFVYPILAYKKGFMSEACMELLRYQRRRFGNEGDGR